MCEPHSENEAVYLTALRNMNEREKRKFRFRLSRIEELSTYYSDQRDVQVAGIIDREGCGINALLCALPAHSTRSRTTKTTGCTVQPC